jgi:hypothetical protein
MTVMIGIDPTRGRTRRSRLTAASAASASCECGQAQTDRAAVEVGGAAS